MRDAGNAFALLHERGGHKRACRREQHVFQLALPYPREYMPAEHRRAAPAAGAARVNVLLFAVEYHHTAVVVPLTELHAVLHEQVVQQVAADISEVAGQYEVEVRGSLPGRFEVRPYRVVSCGCHSRSHIVRVLDTHIFDRADRHGADVWRLRVGSDYGAAACRRRPLGGGSPLSAVGFREAELPFRGAEMRGRERRVERSHAVVRKDRCERKAFCHSRARAVQSDEPCAVVAHTVRRACALVQQVTREYEADVAFRDIPAYQRLFKCVLLETALRFLPCVFSERGILAHIVEAASERSRALHSAHSRAE